MPVHWHAIVQAGIEPILIDRHSELERLRALADAGRHGLALVTGRRRVGKTFLLTHGWGGRRFFYFTASQTTPELNRRQLVEAAAEWSGQTLHPEDYPTWRTVFRLLLELEAPSPLVVVIDEFQYLGEGEAGALAVASELNAVWEAPRAERSFLLVLSGSAVGTMAALAAGGGPLYGRFQWQCTLRPFDYWYTSEMVPYSAHRDRALAYGIFGGTPRYLAAIDPSRPLAENAAQLMLAPAGEVRQLIESALDQEEGLRDVAKYRAILQAIAGGRTRRNEIAQRAGLDNDGAFRQKLGRLVDLGYIEPRQNFEARSNAAIRYGIADAAFRFHQWFVEPNRSALEVNPPEAVWEAAVAPVLDAYMGHEFERIVEQAYTRHAGSPGLPLVAEWGRWEGRDRDLESVEIDVVARLLDKRLLTGSIKWRKAPASLSVHRGHLDMLRRLAVSGQKWANEALEPESPLVYVAAGGFEDGFQEAAAADGHPVTCWSLEDL